MAEGYDFDADVLETARMSDKPKCCSGTSIQENLLNDGYCCAKPGNEGCDDDEEEPGKCPGIRPEKLPTTHLPDEVVVQPATIIVWMTTDGDNPRRGRHAIGISLGDRVNPIMTPQESEYVAAVLQTAVDKVRSGSHERKQRIGGTDFDWPAEGEQIAKNPEWEG